MFAACTPATQINLFKSYFLLALPSSKAMLREVSKIDERYLFPVSVSNLSPTEFIHCRLFWAPWSEDCSFVMSLTRCTLVIQFQSCPPSWSNSHQYFESNLNWHFLLNRMAQQLSTLWGKVLLQSPIHWHLRWPDDLSPRSWTDVRFFHSCFEDVRTASYHRVPSRIWQPTEPEPLPTWGSFQYRCLSFSCSPNFVITPSSKGIWVPAPVVVLPHVYISLWVRFAHSQS